MAELITIRKEIEASLNLHWILQSKDFDKVWKTYRLYNKLTSMSSNLTQYCDQEVINHLLFRDILFLESILDQSIGSITSYLQDKKKRFRLGVYLSNDIEILNWKSIVILINVEYENVEEKMSLWEAIESKVTDIITSYKQKYSEQLSEIEKVNALLSTNVQNFHG